MIVDIAEPEIPGWSIFQTCQFVLFNFESRDTFKSTVLEPGFKGESIGFTQGGVDMT